MPPGADIGFQCRRHFSGSGDAGVSEQLQERNRQLFFPGRPMGAGAGISERIGCDMLQF